MTDIKIVAPDKDHERNDVDTWWYEDSTLVIRFEKDGETERFPNGNVMKRL